MLQCGPQAQDEDVNDDHLDDRELALKPFAERGLGSLFYPEYSPLFPHEKWTLGMTGRPGGPDWYINKQNNTVGHAPGGQSQFPLADMYGDPCFAKVIDGFDALEKVFTQPTIQSGDYRFFFEHPIHIVKAEIVSPMVPQLKPWQVQQQQQTQPDGAQQQDPPKQQELPQQQAVDTQGQQLPQQQQQQQELQQQQPLQQQQQQTQSEQVQQQVPQDSQQQQQQQGQQQGAASSESGKPVEFVHEPGGAAAGPGDGATASGGGKRMRQLMMAKLPPLNVEP